MTVIRTTAVVGADHMLHIALPDDVPTGLVEVEVLITPDQAESLPLGDIEGAAAHGGSFDWLTDEPDLYSSTDGEAL
jgi:hypothetical protein